MLYFSINIFVFLLSVFQCLKPNLKDFKIFLLLIGLFFILLVGLRGSNDEYSRIFVEAPNLLNLLDNRTIAINQGFGFAFICSLFSTIGLSSQALLFSFAFISIFIKFYYFKKYTNYYLLSVFIYLSHTIIHHDWGAIRAGLASSLVLPMIYYLHRKNYLFYFILLFISFSIHYISIISLFLFFSNFKIKPFILLLILLSGYLFSLVGGLDYMLNFLADHNLLPVQLTNYINWDKYNYDVSFLHPKALQQIFLSFLVLYLLHKIDRLKKFYFIINVYILSTFFIVTMSSFAILCFRTSMHFISVEPIVIILVLRCFRWHNYMLICAALFFMFISYINYVHNQALPDYILFSFN
jgi:hypothetical protein